MIGDDVVPTGHPRIMWARERYVDPALLDKMLVSLRRACDANDDESMLLQLRNLIPECPPINEVNSDPLLGRRRAIELCRSNPRCMHLLKALCTVW